MTPRLFSRVLCGLLISVAAMAYRIYLPSRTGILWHALVLDRTVDHRLQSLAILL